MSEIIYQDIEPKEQYEKIIEKVLIKCFKEEEIEKSKLFITITLTNAEYIKKINNEYRNIDKETDVLSFPMFEKEEFEAAKKIEHEEALGDIIISISRVKEQAEEYGHSFERELAYMVVHGFYHLMGEDHMEEEEKKNMREKEENVLSKLQIIR